MSDQSEMSTATTVAIGVGAAAVLGFIGYAAYRSSRGEPLIGALSADKQERLTELQRQVMLLSKDPARWRGPLRQIEGEVKALKAEGGLNALLGALGDANFAIGDVLKGAAPAEYTVVDVRRGWVQLTAPEWRKARWREVSRDSAGLYATDLDEQPIRKVSGLRSGAFTFSAGRKAGGGRGF